MDVIGFAVAPSNVETRGFTLHPTDLTQLLQHSGEQRFPRLFGEVQQHRDAGHPPLCMCRQRPSRRTAETRDERTPPHSHPSRKDG
jgi:hypothetical protein